MQVSFRKRATDHRALLRKMTYKDKASYGSSPHCSERTLAKFRMGSERTHTHVLQCVAVCCSVLQCVAVRCSELQCVAVCCSVLQCVSRYDIHSMASRLTHSAPRCNTLLHTATHCSTHTHISHIHTRLSSERTRAKFREISNTKFFEYEISYDGGGGNGNGGSQSFSKVSVTSVLY